MIKYLTIWLALFACFTANAQTRKVDYHPCFLKDSVDARLNFIRLNAGRIFIDSFDCKEALLDSIALGFVKTKDVKYLDVLNAIRQNPYAKADDLYTDIIRLLVQDDFTGFINQLYLARGKYLPLQNELIAAMNMIINGQPMKQKYMGILNMEIDAAKDHKDKYRELYLEKLKLKIEEEKYR